MIGETLFWSHLAVVLGSIVSGFFLPLYLVVVLIIAHKIHLLILGDCLFTVLKRYAGCIGPNEHFLQCAAKRLFGSKISQAASERLNYLIYVLTIAASLSRHLLLS